MEDAVAEYLNRSAWGARHAPVLGFLSLGLAGALLLVVAARADRPSTFNAIGLVWTLSTAFGVGAAVPFEQLMIRRLTAGVKSQRRPAALLVLTGALFSLGVIAYATTSGSELRTPPAVAAALASVASWCILVPARARLAADASLPRYGACLVVEGAARAFMVSVVALGGVQSLLWLGAAVWAPMVVAAVVAFRWGSPGVEAGGTPPRAQASVFVVAIGFQLCLNGPVLVLGRGTHPGGGAAFAEFLAAATYFRSPALILGGLAVQLLVALGVPSARTAGARTAYRRVLRSGWLAIGMATGSATVLSHWLLPLYLGRPGRVELVVRMALALGTLLVCIAYLMLQAALVLNRGWAAGCVWLLSAGVSVTATLAVGRVLEPDSAPFLASALLAGPMVAFVGACLTSRSVWSNSEWASAREVRQLSGESA